jgi:hypothetical protein
MQYEIIGFMELVAFVGQLSDKATSLYFSTTAAVLVPLVFDNQKP